MVDGELSGRALEHADDVDAHLVEQHPVCHQPADGKPPQPSSFAPVDGLQRRPVTGTRPGFPPRRSPAPAARPPRHRSRHRRSASCGRVSAGRLAAETPPPAVRPPGRVHPWGSNRTTSDIDDGEDGGRPPGTGPRCGTPPPGGRSPVDAGAELSARRGSMRALYCAGSYLVVAAVGRWPGHRLVIRHQAHPRLTTGRASARPCASTSDHGWPAGHGGVRVSLISDHGADLATARFPPAAAGRSWPVPRR